MLRFYSPFLFSIFLSFYSASFPPFLFHFFLMIPKQMKHNVICSTVEQGVASPIRNKETGSLLLMRKDTGTLMRL